MGIVITLLAANAYAADTAPYQFEEYTGNLDYKGKIKNMSILDIGNHWAKDDIVHLSGLGIIRATESSNFRPSSDMTRKEALKYLVRQRGKEGDAAAQTFEAGYLAIAQTEGIITPEEAASMSSLTAAETASLDTQLVALREKMEANIDTEEADIVAAEAALRKSYADSRTWNKPLTKQEAALWIARNIGATPQSGTDIQKVYTFNDYAQIDLDKVPYIEALAEEGIVRGDSKGNFSPRSSIDRGEFASLMVKTDDKFLEARGNSYKDGKVDTIEKATNYTTIKLDNLEDKSISQVDIVLNDAPAQNSGFVVYKDGKLRDHKALVKDDYLRYYVDTKGKVVYAEVHDYPITTKTVTLANIGEDITVKDLKTGLKTKYPLDVRANLFVNDIHVFKKDFLEGMEAKIKIRNGKIVEINGIVDEGEPGIVDRGTHFSGGKVLYTDPKNKKITLKNEDGIEKTFTIKPYTPINKQDRAIEISQIKPGDIIRLEFDSLDMSDPSRLNVAAQDKQIERFVKGKLAQYDARGEKALLENVYTFEGNAWTKAEAAKTFNLDDTVLAYVEGQPIRPEQLKDYQGRDIYLATRSDFGDEVASQFIVKSGYEKKYIDHIQDIAYGNQQMKIDFADVSYNDGTIIIKDGRLIDPYSLEAKDNVQVYTYGDNAAAIIAVDNPAVPSNFAFVRGRIDSMTKYTVDMRYYDALENQNWQTYKNERKTISLNEDTAIKDLRLKTPLTGQSITVDEFTKRRTDINPSSANYLRQNAYSVIHDGVALAVSVVDAADTSQIVTSGKIESIDASGGKIVIKDGKDWSPFTEKWRTNTAKINLDISKATFIKNKKAVALSELTPEDKLYVLRRNDKGYIVVIE